MRLLHIADLHLGRKLDQYSLLSEQKDNLKQVITYIQDKEIDALLISGDIFDKKQPKGEAIDVYRDFIQEVVSYCDIYAIAGNHDNVSFHQFASDLLKESRYHIVGQTNHPLTPFELTVGNEVAMIYLCPYMDVPTLREVIDNDDIQEENEGMATLIESLSLKPEVYNILLYHGFVTGRKECLFSDSERFNTLGTSQAVDVNLFNEFDYVALGHLHRFQQVDSSPCYYSGSLYCYSESEIGYDKGMIDIQLNDNHITPTFIPFIPPRQVRQLTGTCDELLNVAESDDYMYIKLTSRHMQSKFHQLLKSRFPHLVQISQQYVFDEALKKQDQFDFDNHLEGQIQQYYELIYDKAMSDEELNILHEVMKEED